VNRVFLTLLLTKVIFGGSFLSQFEYGQMFYDNPRGVSCAKCHGKLGEGAYIGEFVDDNGKVHSFSGPDITNISFDKFVKAINKGGLLMPRYYLTNKEIKAIYEYIKIVNSSNKKDEIIDEQEAYDGIDFNYSYMQDDANSSNEKNNKDTQIDIKTSINKFENNSDINVQDSFIEGETIYQDEIESADNNKDSIISNIFNSINEKGD